MSIPFPRPFRMHDDTRKQNVQPQQQAITTLANKPIQTHELKQSAQPRGEMMEQKVQPQQQKQQAITTIASGIQMTQRSIWSSFTNAVGCMAGDVVGCAETQDDVENDVVPVLVSSYNTFV